MPKQRNVSWTQLRTRGHNVQHNHTKDRPDEYREAGFLLFVIGPQVAIIAAITVASPGLQATWWKANMAAS